MLLVWSLIMVVFLHHNAGVTINSDSSDLCQCSKFHFEEKVLEKLVKLEHRVEMYTDKLKQREIEFSSGINKMDNFLGSASVTLTEKQQELNDTVWLLVKDFLSSASTTLRSEVINFNEIVQTKVDEIGDKTAAYHVLMEMLNKTISGLDEGERKRNDRTSKKAVRATILDVVKNHNTNQTVAFTTCANQKKMKTGEPILFASTIAVYGVRNLNLADKGYFKCERHGLYFVSVSVLAKAPDPLFYIYKNSRKLVIVYPTNVGSKHWYSGSASVVIQLDINDQISVKAGRNVEIYGDEGLRGTYFSLIKIA